VALGEVCECGLDEGFAIVPRVGEHLLVLNDLDIVHAEDVAFADELDRLQRAVADIDTPGETRVCHDVSSCRLPPSSEWAGVDWNDCSVKVAKV
jgi:hypothetical protein